MISLPTIDQVDFVSIERKNVQVYFEKTMQVESTEAYILSLLHELATISKTNLGILLPVFRGIITLKEGNLNGKVIVNTGTSKGKRYYHTELRYIMQEPLDKTER